MTMDAEGLADFFKAQGASYKRCLGPTMSCGERVIRAHSIQNKRALELLQVNGKVMMMRGRTGKAGPKVDLELVGRNQASVFTGLCSEHDREIFLDIDTKPLDPNDRRQLFLMAYRSVTKELHTLLEEGMKQQIAYQQKVKRGRIPRDEPTPEGMFPMMTMFKSWLLWRYRHTHFDEHLLKGTPDSLVHETFVLDDQDPTIAVSGVYSVETFLNGGQDFNSVILNIVPLPGRRTLVAFTYAPDQAAVVKPHLDEVLKLEGDERKLALSKLVIERLENFTMHPHFVKSWSPEKRKAIMDAFTSTIMDPPTIETKPEFMLF